MNIEKPSLTRELMNRFCRCHERNIRIFHIVIDDANCNRDSAEFCLEKAIEDGDEEKIYLARLLSRMSPTQMRKLHRFSISYERTQA